MTSGDATTDDTSPGGPLVVDVSLLLRHAVEVHGPTSVPANSQNEVITQKVEESVLADETESSPATRRVRGSVPLVPVSRVGPLTCNRQAPTTWGIAQGEVTGDRSDHHPQ